MRQNCTKHPLPLWPRLQIVCQCWHKHRQLVVRSGNLHWKHPGTEKCFPVFEVSFVDLLQASVPSSETLWVDCTEGAQWDSYLLLERLANLTYFLAGGMKNTFNVCLFYLRDAQQPTRINTVFYYLDFWVDCVGCDVTPRMPPGERKAAELVIGNLKNYCQSFEDWHCFFLIMMCSCDHEMNFYWCTANCIAPHMWQWNVN